jgi:bacillithiol biosynthesis deacetylase BshB1
MKLDVLAFAAHPDDVEISCGGTIAKLVSQGRKVGIVDLTRGELGTRGNGILRLEEAEASAKILGLSARENLGLRDGFFIENETSQRLIIQQLRKYRPEIVLANSVTDRHIDHGRGARLVADACFLSGLRKIKTEEGGNEQEAWRPRAVYHYIQDYYIKPDFVVDVSEYFEQKMKAIEAYSSQFYDPESEEPSTPISGEDFFDFLKSRAMEFGRPAGVKYAEGFTTNRFPAVDDLFDLR